jgi:two-component system cell cycle sensor histidine kinase/response regulator CckA
MPEQVVLQRAMPDRSKRMEPREFGQEHDGTETGIEVERRLAGPVLAAEQRWAHQELRASEEWLRQLGESIREVFWLSDSETQRLVYVSPAYEELWGRTCQSLYERPDSFLEAVVPEDRERVRATLQRDGQGQSVDFRIVRPDGTVRWIRSHTFPLQNLDGESSRLASIAQDITEQKESEPAAIRTEELAPDDARGLATAGKLAASLVHELNNPMQSVIGCLALAQESLAAGEDASRYLQVARDELRRTTRIVSQLHLLYQRSHGGVRTPIDLNRLVEQVLAQTRQPCREGRVEVVCLADADLPLVPVVPALMRQVFLNLVLNALDAMPQGGRLEVSTVRTSQPSGVRVTFTDSGAGMSPTVLSRMFDPFFSTKSGGLGLGLFVTQTIVQQHGGHIGARSWPKEGTTLDVWLPL